MATGDDIVLVGSTSVLPEAPVGQPECLKDDEDDWDTIMTTYAKDKQSSRKRVTECEGSDGIKKTKLSPQSQDSSNDLSCSDNDDGDSTDDKTVTGSESKEMLTPESKRKGRKKKKKKKRKKCKMTPKEKLELEQKRKAAKLIEALSIYLIKHTCPKVDRSTLGVYSTKAFQSAARHVVTKDTLDQLSFCDTSDVERIMFVWLSSVSAEMYLSQPGAFTNLSKLPSYPFLIKHPGSETFCESGRDAFLTLKIENENIDLSMERTKCLLSSDSLKKNGYPLNCACHGKQDSSPSVSKTDVAEEGEVESADNDDYWCLIGDKEGLGVSDTSPLFAIDCEMVSTTHDSTIGDVARVSVVNEEGECVYDTYVKPSTQIIDYRTIYSGITAEVLENITTTMADVQARFKELIPHDAILVGQSLENDLHSLKLYHPHVIDTALLFNNNSRHKPKLKVLAQRLLKTTIQKYGEGHSSIEDALTCMKLVQLKLERGSGISFSLSGQSGTINNTYNIGLFQLLCSSGKSCAFIDRHGGVLDHSQGNVHSIVAETDGEAVRRAKSAVRSNDVSWIELHGVQDYLNQPGTALAHAKIQENFLHQKALQLHSNKGKAVALAATKKGTSKEEIERIQKEGRMQAVECLLESIDVYGEAYKQEAASINQAIRQLDNHVYSLIQACPKGTLVFTICGSGEVDRIPQLYKATKHCPAEELIQSELKRVVKEAREGLVLAHYVMNDCVQL